MRRGARHHHDNYDNHPTNLSFPLRIPVVYDRNYYNDHDDAPGDDHDESLAGCLRVRGRSVGKRRLCHDHDHYDHHHDHYTHQGVS